MKPLAVTMVTSGAVCDPLLSLVALPLLRMIICLSAAQSLFSLPSLPMLDLLKTSSLLSVLCSNQISRAQVEMHALLDPIKKPFSGTQKRYKFFIKACCHKFVSLKTVMQFTWVF